MSDIFCKMFLDVWSHLILIRLCNHEFFIEIKLILSLNLYWNCLFSSAFDCSWMHCCWSKWSCSTIVCCNIFGNNRGFCWPQKYRWTTAANRHIRFTVCSNRLFFPFWSYLSSMLIRKYSLGVLGVGYKIIIHSASFLKDI